MKKKDAWDAVMLAGEGISPILMGGLIRIGYAMTLSPLLGELTGSIKSLAATMGTTPGEADKILSELKKKRVLEVYKLKDKRIRLVCPDLKQTALTSLYRSMAGKKSAESKKKKKRA